MDNDLKQESLDYHQYPQAGKLASRSTKSMDTQNDLALAYSPGVAAPCLEIKNNPVDVAKYTSRGNLVGVYFQWYSCVGFWAILGPWHQSQ